MNSKKIISGLLAVTMAFSSAVFTVSADSADAAVLSGSSSSSNIGVVFGEKFYYSVLDGGRTVKLLGFTKKAISGKTLRIPAKIDGKKVALIGSDMGQDFADNRGKIKVVDIPRTVMDLEEGWMAYGWYDGTYYHSDGAGLAIVCYKNSAAEKYAAANGIRYRLKNGSKNHVTATRFKTTEGINRSAIKLKWQKSDNATGYRIYRRNNNTGRLKKLADVNAKTLFYMDTNPDKNSYNQYVVRGFRKSGGKTYWSDFSSEKAVCVADERALKLKGSKIVERDYTRWIDLEIDTTDIQEGEFFNDTYSIEVLDPYTNEWSMPSYYYHVAQYTDGEPCAENTEVFEIASYMINKYGAYRYESIDKGQTYKIRVKRSVTVYDSMYFYEDSGARMTRQSHNHDFKATTATVTVE